MAVSKSGGAMKKVDVSSLFAGAGGNAAKPTQQVPVSSAPSAADAPVVGMSSSGVNAGTSLLNKLRGSASSSATSSPGPNNSARQQQEGKGQNSPSSAATAGIRVMSMAEASKK
jgi:hypothetical protein